MKTLLLTPALMLFSYCIWTCLNSREKTAFKRLVRRHALAMVLMALFLAATAWTAVNFSSLQVL